MLKKAVKAAFLLPQVLTIINIFAIFIIVNINKNNSPEVKGRDMAMMMQVFIFLIVAAMIIWAACEVVWRT
ncbi:MAG: hypothetical protein H8E28_14880 [Anaerolineae bacterium]|nr:hypothetical protein [Anaerolineae bacterium]